MLLLEIAAQGVKGIAPAGGRIALRPGYNVVTGAEGPVLRRLLESLLWPTANDGDALPHTVAGPGGGPVRAGVTLVGDDRVTYRLVRDFAAGAQLQRFDPDKRSFAVIAQDLAEIGSLLVTEAGVPSHSRFQALLSLSAADLPSRGAPAGLGGLGVAALAPPPRRSLSPEQARRRIAELREELARAQRAEAAQDRLDGLQTRLSSLEGTLRDEAKLRESAEAAEAQLRDLARAGEVADQLGDLEARLAVHARALARHEEAQARVAEERAAIDALEGRGPPRPVWGDPPFLGAIAAGVVLFVAGMVGAALAPGSGFRYVALLDIVAFGGAALLALRHVGRLEQHSRVGRRRQRADERAKKAADQFARETQDLRAAVEALGLAGVPELKEVLARLASARAARAEALASIEAWQARSETRVALSEKARLEGEVREAESRLAAEAGGYVREPRAIEAEIARLEAEASAPPGVPAEPVPVAAAAAPPASDPIRALLEQAGAELSQSPAAVARGLQPKAGPALAAISGQRFTTLQVDDRGNLLAVLGGRPQPVSGLPAADRDLVFLALRLALIDQEMAAGKALAFAEDAFGAQPDGARRMAARLLKQAARPGQLLHTTRDAAFREAADHTT